MNHRFLLPLRSLVGALAVTTAVGWVMPALAAGQAPSSTEPAKTCASSSASRGPIQKRFSMNLPSTTRRRLQNSGAHSFR